ncbi:MAG TPA: GxxExxY protein [Gemmatimonadaceae bacterium]|nr:GxxExxY protein [Gemmatimonadaceae bacterium]
MDQELLTGKVIGRAMKVHGVLGPGYLESVYLNALALELNRAGLSIECEKDIQVRYEDTVVGDFRVDMLVEGFVIVEIKAVRALAPAHEAQLVNYLTATGIDIGLLLNFGAPRLEFRRKSRLYRPRSERYEEPLEERGQEDW